MPYMTQEQIDEIQHEMGDLVDENAELRKINAALEAALREFKARYPELG